MVLQMLPGKYRIKSPTIALFENNGHHAAALVPVGAIVEVASATFDGDTLVEVIWDERRVIMFSKDLRRRGKDIG
jgi:hypothetical protein